MFLSVTQGVYLIYINNKEQVCNKEVGGILFMQGSTFILFFSISGLLSAWLLEPVLFLHQCLRLIWGGEGEGLLMISQR